MAESTAKNDQVVEFLRKHDYKLVRELGQGACGKTVLLYDEYIDTHFVCKKYVPFSEERREELFLGFVKEVKLLHQLYHDNVVRIFNHYLYPEHYTGYILMEFIDGSDIDKYIAHSPENVNDVFLQTIAGFTYLEKTGILHRDIRPGNVMVSGDGVVKIIDLGFGKKIRNSKDFAKSITLNWWCEPPAEFNDGRYDFQSEVYFVGKLFEGLIRDYDISHFKYPELLGQMCHRKPETRTASFIDIEQQIGTDQFIEIDFTDQEKQAYRSFSERITSQIEKIDTSAKYVDDVGRMLKQLEECYRSFMLEIHVPDAAVVLRCLITGAYYYRSEGLLVQCVRDMVHLLKTSTDEKRRIIVANLHTNLDALPRYSPTTVAEDDIPF